MNTKAIRRNGILINSRIFSIAGAVGLLFALVLVAHADTTTNGVEMRQQAALASKTSAADMSYMLEMLFPTPELLKFDNISAGSRNHVVTPPAITANIDLLSSILPANETDSSNSLTGFLMVGTALDSNPPPVITGATSISDTATLALEDPGEQTVEYPQPWVEVNLGWGNLLMQFFVPSVFPAPPGERLQSGREESDRAWPVMAAGGATGNSWNEPCVYKAQRWLSINW
ncbi:MAG: hypothetical protein QM813_08960 [Verrucomicrobiota bacterium]